MTKIDIHYKKMYYLMYIVYVAVNMEKVSEFKDKVKEMIADCQSSISQASTLASEAVGLAG